MRHPSRRRGAIALAVGLGLLAPPAWLPVARAQEAAVAEAPVDPTPFLGTDWYGAYIQGQKAGYASMSLARETREGVAVVVGRFEGYFKIRAGGNTIEMRMAERRTFAADGAQRLVEAWQRQAQGAMAVERQATVGAGRMVVRTTTGGQPSGETTVDAPALRLADELGPQLLVASGPAVGARREHRSLDLDTLTEDTDVATVTAVVDGFADGVAVKLYTLAMKDGKTGDTATATARAPGRLVELDFGGLIKVRLEPEKLAKDIQYSGDLFLSGLAKPDRPLGDPRTVRRLVLRLQGVGEAPLVDDGRQTVTRGADGAVVVTIDAQAPRERLRVPTEAELTDARRPTLQHPSDHPEMVAAAKTAVGDAATDADRVARLVRWVSDHVEDAMSLTEITALDVLRGRKGDCSEHTMLFVAVARAAGLAARPVSGLMYAGDRMAAFGGHAWAEVAVDGRWVAVDPPRAQVVVDATHLRLGVEDQSEALLRFHGKVQIAVVELERFPVPAPAGGK